MPTGSSEEADARALAALLGTELGAALLQGRLQVHLLPPLKERLPLGNSLALANSHPHVAAPAAIEAQMRRRCDLSTSVQIMSPLESPASHELPPRRGADDAQTGDAELRSPSADQAQVLGGTGNY